jgi:hypothetical protein
MSNGFIVAARNTVRKVVMQEWKVYRLNPETDTMDEYDLICESGTFFTHYRMLGRGDDTLASDTPEYTLYDPYTDDWDRELTSTWTEAVEIQQR